MRFVPHPALRVVRSRYAVATIFHAYRGAEPPGRIDAGIAQTALVTRPGMHVGVRGIGAGAAAFVESLAAGSTLAEAAGAGEEADGDFDLSGAIALVVSAGAFTATKN